MVKQYPCNICSKCVKNNQKGLLCTGCKIWVHIGCASVPVAVYDDASECFFDWKCPKCLLKQLPFFDENYPVIYEESHNSPVIKCEEDLDDINFDRLHEKGLRCVQLNIVSLMKNIDELKSILIKHDIHICALNETRLDEDINDGEIKIPGYSIIRRDRNRRGGGVAIYIKDYIQFKVFKDRSFSDLEAILISIELKKSQPMFFLNWYRPPSSKSEVLSIYEDVLSFMSNFNFHSIIMGDINIDISKKPFSHETKKYDRINNIYGYHYVNTTKCTRITSETATLIDHMLTNNPEKIKTSGVLEVCMGDHFLNFLVWKSYRFVTHSHNDVTFRKSRGIDWEAFREDLRKENWSDIQKFDDIDDAVKKWEDMVTSVINKHMPLKTKRMRKKYSPWLNESIFELMKQRDNIKRRAIRQKSEYLWKEYKKLRNKVTFVIRKTKRQYYVDKLAECPGKNQTWTVLKSFLPNNNTSSNLVCDDSYSKACEFNDHFANVATDLLNKRNNCVGDCHAFNLPEQGKRENTFTAFNLVSEVEVMDEIIRLKNKKSVGVDNISVQVLKSCSDILIKAITYLINKSLIGGKVSNFWKIAKVIPLHKKGDRSNPDNYRPISLLPCISKLLERIVQLQLLRYLQDNEIMAEVQSGFRANHSTMTALAKVTDDWLMAMDVGEYTGVVFVDLQKAFDTVDHQVLLNKLSTNGIKGVVLQWFKSYLTNRRIVTKVNDTLSEENDLTHGVPQGSLLGPLLFCIFINDLPDIFRLSRVHLYADDTVIYCSNQNLNVVESTLNTEMQILDRWMSQTKLLINYIRKLSVCSLVLVKCCQNIIYLM